jgi:hypothetical protein
LQRLHSLPTFSSRPPNDLAFSGGPPTDRREGGGRPLQRPG